MSPRIRLAVPVLIAGSILLAACRGVGTTPSDQPISHPDGDALVFRYGYSGGFVPMESIFTNLPSFSLMGDGRVIVQGAQAAIYPGPALPSIQVRRLSESGIQAVLAEIMASGQFASSAQWLAAQRNVADAPNTDFVLHAGGRDVTVTVYALGIWGPDAAAPGTSDAELEAHRSLGALVEQLSALDALLPANAWADAEWQSYRGDALRLLVRNVDGEAPDPSGLDHQVLDWPTDADPSTFGELSTIDDGSRCGVVTGADADAWYATLMSANQLTRWTAGAHAYAVLARPLLPDEPRVCP
jgi:hypothetical protein